MNCLFVGAGNVAGRYAKSLAASSLDLVGICDLDEGRADDLAGRHDARSYTDLAAMFAREDAPLVVNLTSHAAHAPITRRALQAGRHVFSEKPLALDAETAAELVTIAQEAGLALGCAPRNDAADAQRHAHGFVGDGRLGEVGFVAATANVGRVGEWHDRPDSFLSVGPLYDGGVYPLNLLVAWFGRVASVRRADAPDLWPPETSPNAVRTAYPHVEATLQFAAGPVVALRASFYVDHRSREFYGLECHGDDGTVYLADAGALAAERDAVTVRGGDRPSTVAPHPAPERERSHLAPVETLAARVQANDPDRRSARRAAHVVAVCNAVDRAVETGDSVDVPHRVAVVREPAPNTRQTVEGASGPLELPPVGFGCSRYRDGEYVTPALGAAIDAGYRLFDGAELYGNEWRLGELLDGPGGPDREHVFLVGKPWRTNHGPGQLEAACRGSLAELGVDAFDCYALHWPGAWEHVGPLDRLSTLPLAEQERLTFPTTTEGRPATAPHTLSETWARMEALVDAGLARTLGVCNVTLPQLAALVDRARLPPALVQVECHPGRPRHELVRWCRKRDIRVVAHSPLPAELRSNASVAAVANAHGVSPTAVLLAWQVERGVVPIPTTTSRDHAVENLTAARHRLTTEETQTLNELGA